MHISICRMNTRWCNGATGETTKGSGKTPPKRDGASLDEPTDVGVRSQEDNLNYLAKSCKVRGDQLQSIIFVFLNPVFS